MTRRLNLDLPVRCAKCGQKFTRTHGRQKLCPLCKRNDVKARIAVAEQAAALAELAAMADGSDCRYPACGHSLRDRKVDLHAGTCSIRGC